MGVWYLARRFRRDPRTSVAELAGLLGLGRTTTKAALRAAEAAGLIAVRRAPGRKLVLSLRKIPGDGPEPKPLRGPIPWGWWVAACRLRGPSLRVAAVCWLVAGRRRSAEFELGLSEWAELGLSRFAAGRGLHALERAGLVSLRYRPGGSPLVTVQEASCSQYVIL
jgi:DNA-binding transcriptional ArsR family regulator